MDSQPLAEEGVSKELKAILSRVPNSKVNKSPAGKRAVERKVPQSLEAAEKAVVELRRAFPDAGEDPFDVSKDTLDNPSDQEEEGGRVGWADGTRRRRNDDEEGVARAMVRAAAAAYAEGEEEEERRTRRMTRILCSMKARRRSRGGV